MVYVLFSRWPGAGFDGYPPSSSYDHNGYNHNSVKEERITTVLQKGLRGFGFTIVGGDHPDELLQVKSIVPGGPASVDGKIRIGDALTKVNGMYWFV
jgi:C-terminal processing protease CtpA/Prc